MRPAILEADPRSFLPERPPVLLLGGLDLLRPLGFAGIPAIVASPDAHEPAFVSRYCAGRCRLPALDQPEAAADCLLAAGDLLVRALGRKLLLVYGNDDYLSMIHARRAEFSRSFLLLLNAPEIDEAMLNKDRFEALARERGLIVPRKLSWNGGGADTLATVSTPVLVKPRSKVAWDVSAIHLKLFGGAGKSRIFANGREVLAHPLVRQLRNHLSFQDYVAGDDRQLWSFHGYADHDGELLASFVGRKLRTYPALTGMSTFLELAHNDELAAAGRCVVARLPLRGVFKIDFKQDANSGRYFLLEINARFNLWHHVAARNGVNLLQAAYDYLVDGRRPLPADYGTGVRWLCFRLDLRAYRELAARGELSLAAWLLSLARSPLVHNLFSWSDPLPWLYASTVRVVLRARRALLELRTWLRQWHSTAS